MKPQTEHSGSAVSTELAAGRLLDEVLTHSIPTPAKPCIPAPGNLVFGIVTSVQNGMPVILYEFENEVFQTIAVAAQGSFNDQSDVGVQVCLAFDRQDLTRPIVLGKLATSTRVSENTLISSDKSITLRCGKASIQLKADGTVSIRGTNIASRASHTNRIRGGNVQIN